MELLPEDVKKEIKAMAKEYLILYLATNDDGCPRVRPVTMGYLDSKFWILTGSDDAKVKHIRGCPQIEICYPISKEEANGYIRASGTAKIISELDSKASVAERCPYFTQYWETPMDPRYTLLELEFDWVEYLKPGAALAKRYKL